MNPEDKMSLKLTLYNTMSRSKEPFETINPGKAILYVCGITPYSNSHIGHGRSYVNFDVLVRLLKFMGLETTYIRNLTDIDDKLLKKATDAGDITSYKKIAQEFISDYHEHMNSLNNLEPDIEPLATESIPGMISLIEILMKKDQAYTLGNDIYFDISTLKKYGNLSGKNIEELEEGARVKATSGKRNAGDFVLWKGNENEEFWASPFGHGRPGWHIECSAMIHDAHQGTIDIHGGGADLIFPHHEDEIAQSESAYSYPLANFWVHNALLNLDKEKMSKSIGNILSLKEMLKTVDPMVLKFYFLQHSYRTPIDFSSHGLSAAKKAYYKLVSILGQNSISEPLIASNIDQTNKIIEQIIEALMDDLNTPQALGLIFKHSSEIKNDSELASSINNIVVNVLGIKLTEETFENQSLSEKAQRLIMDRENARANKDWEKADQIRDQLSQMGVTISDKK
jgi:cysteinyl-tRNA synthetase